MTIKEGKLYITEAEEKNFKRAWMVSPMTPWISLFDIYNNKLEESESKTRTFDFYKEAYSLYRSKKYEIIK